MTGGSDGVDVPGLARSLRAEAGRANERRVLVLSGDVARTREAAAAVADAVDVAVRDTTTVGPEAVRQGERVDQRRADELLGRTRDLVVLDCHEAFRPNALGRVVGAVDGGGLLLLLTPSLDSWPDERDGFDEGMAVPPFGLDEVTGRFRQRFVDLAVAHRGIAVVDVDAGERLADGSIDAAPSLESSRSAGRPATLDHPETARFPREAYDACRTQDQVEALFALESLRDPGSAVVVAADRGRGKSSAIGLAAGAFAATGEDVVVTAPERRGAREVFERARELLDSLDQLATSTDSSGASSSDASGGPSSDASGGPPSDASGGPSSDASGQPSGDTLYSLQATPATETPTGDEGGSVQFVPVADVERDPDRGDVLLVDEAAAIPVRRLASTLAADRVAYATTVHGYEGTGRGFDVRFRGRLEDSEHDVVDASLVEPIRYAAGDPVEVWAFRALMLDARPPADELVADATPATVEYAALSPETLVADENLLGEVFGSLVLAHYRTEPDDLARLLDAPNLRVRALTHDGHVACVALLAREGDLPADVRASMYEGGRVKGNMLPDVLTSQLRDESAGRTVGDRVVRIATHHAVREEGLASHLLDRVRDEVAGDVDWLGSGFGATPGLLDFWRSNDFSSVHLSTTRNDASGEYSVLVFDPLTEEGQALVDRHAEWFAERIPGVLSDSLADCDPDVVRATLRACDADVDLDLSAFGWRTVVAAANGPGLFDVAPAPFRDIAVKYFVDPGDAEAESGGQNDGEQTLSAHEERLLVRRVLQGGSWERVARDLEFVSASACRRALGRAYARLVDAYAPAEALAERDRFRD